MALRWLRSQRRRGGERVRLQCVEHELDLAALQRFIDDGRPDADDAALSRIAAGECPACLPRYVAGTAEKATTRGTDGSLYCPCCRTRWSSSPPHWVASADGGLQIVAAETPLPAGVTIDSSSFRVETLDDDRALQSVLRSELASAPGIAYSVDSRIGEVIAYIVEAATAAAEGRANEGAEIWWSISESGLDPLTREALLEKATTALAAIHRLLDGDGGGGGESSVASCERDPQA